jgi:hypothetical protein
MSETGSRRPPETPDGLERDLRRQLGGLAQGQEGVGLPDLPVLREVAARLPHDPHGGNVDRLAPARLEEPVLRHFDLGQVKVANKYFNKGGRDFL